MNIIKLLKAVWIGYVAGQLVATKYWNREVSKKLNESKNEWSKKFQTLFDHLMNVNRDFVSDVRSYDYQKSAEDMKLWAQDQYSSIETQITSIKEKWEDYINSPEVQKVVAKLQDQVASVKSKTSKLANDFDLNEKFENISSNLKSFGENIANKTQDLKESAQDKLEDVKYDAKKVANNVQSKFDQAKDVAEDKISDVKWQVKDVAQDVKKTINTATNKVENKANEIKSDAKKIAKNVADEYEYDMDSKPHGNVQIEFKKNK